MAVIYVIILSDATRRDQMADNQRGEKMKNRVSKRILALFTSLFIVGGELLTAYAQGTDDADVSETVQSEEEETENTWEDAAKCDRDTIRKGCEMLGMEVAEVAEICIEGMKAHAEEIGLAGTV